MPTTKLTNEVLLAAIEGFESQKRRIDEQIAELRQMMTGAPAAEPASPAPSRKGARRMSAAARARIAEAQRKRWAAQKATGSPGSAGPSPAPKAKRKLSAAGRRAIIEATKRRWAKARAEAAKAESKPAAKKS